MTLKIHISGLPKQGISQGGLASLSAADPGHCEPDNRSLINNLTLYTEYIYLFYSPEKELIEKPPWEATEHNGNSNLLENILIVLFTWNSLT